MANVIKQFIDFLKKEFNSYPKNIKITLGVLMFFVLGFIIFGIQILFWGLGYTDMSNVYPFGQWIIGDLGLVGLGGGAFTTGFLLYIFRNDKLTPLINSTVLIGFMCYLFTLVFLVFDIGQPLRAWFGYTYPNWGPHLMPQSMLTEVVWCLTLYFCILCVEMIPVVLKHKVLDAIPALHYIGHYLHRLMWIFAAGGTFLSFFHQGSLGGGMWDIMYGKASWFRAHHIYFFVVIIGATAGGTAFMTLCAYIAGKVMKKEVVPKETFHSIAKVSGIMLSVYFVARIIDVSLMATKWTPLFDRSFAGMMGGYYGWWMLAVEFILLIVAISMLLIKKNREQEKTFLVGISTGAGALFVNKLFVVLNGSSVPNFPWKSFAAYNPTIQEWFIFLGGLSVMVLIYMWFAKYTPLFPHAEHAHHEGGEQQGA
ncbi:MAG: polysulfide reductase NrfD [Spirochaetes bacterium]|nr:polysulfide reductase NrfD [Spirochaetota bacterium]